MESRELVHLCPVPWLILPRSAVHICLSALACTHKEDICLYCHQLHLQWMSLAAGLWMNCWARPTSPISICWSADIHWGHLWTIYFFSRPGTFYSAQQLIFKWIHHWGNITGTLLYCLGLCNIQIFHLASVTPKTGTLCLPLCLPFSWKMDSSSRFATHILDNKHLMNKIKLQNVKQWDYFAQHLPIKQKKYCRYTVQQASTFSFFFSSN